MAAAAAGQRYSSLPQHEEGDDDTSTANASRSAAASSSERLSSDGEAEGEGEEAGLGLLGLKLIRSGGERGERGTRAGAGLRFPNSSSPASASGSTAGLSPMTFLSLADSTFTPLSMTSTNSDLYIGSFGDEDLDKYNYTYNDSDEEEEEDDGDDDEKDHGAAQSPSHSKSKSKSKCITTITTITTSTSEDQQPQHQPRRHHTAASASASTLARWPRRRSLLKSSSASGLGLGLGMGLGGGGGGGGGAALTATATPTTSKMATHTQSLHPPTRARARAPAAATETGPGPGTGTGIETGPGSGNGYGLLLANSPTPDSDSDSDSDNNIANDNNNNNNNNTNSEKRPLNRSSHHDAHTITPSSSVSPAIDKSLSLAGADITTDDDIEEKNTARNRNRASPPARASSTSHSPIHDRSNANAHEESEEATQTQLQDSLGLARHDHIADTHKTPKHTKPHPHPHPHLSTHPPSPSNSRAPQPVAASSSSPELIRPKFVRKSLPPSVTSPTSTATSSSSSPPLPQLSSAGPSPIQSRRHSPTIIRTASVSSVLRHPVPDLNTRSGAYTGNIAALEATAERLSMTSSIEDAIRNAHDELKRSDSRRSSILASSVRSVSGEHTIEGLDKILPPPSIRQSSILELNNAARLGGYSPAGFVMSPNHSLSSRLRSGSKSSAGPLSRHSSTKSRPGETVEGDAFPFLSRAGPGKGSVHSVHSVHSARSAQLSLAEIAEMEPPTSLTQEAMEAADHAAWSGPDVEDEETIRINALQHVEPGATDIEVDMDLTPNADTEARQPMLDHALDSYWNDEPSPQLQLRNPENPVPYRDEYQPPTEQRPTSAGSHGTYEQTNAFDDFDGVHCDPDTVAEQFPFHPEEAQFPPPVQRQSRPISQLPARPKSYFDTETGQQMLYYPARVPAMLNLPRKLGKGPRAPARNVRRSQILSAMPEASRESRVWLPDPLEGQMGSPLMDERHSTSSRGPASGSVEQFPQMPEPAVQDVPGPTVQDEQPPELQHLRRPAKLTDADRRKSRMSAMPELPPQLRASAFFDLPSAPAPKIEIKDGSAMATLDSILDAAASAPVSAFTDHAFAGKLGSEVYGPVKQKKNRQSQMPGGNNSDKGHKARASTATALGVPEVEKRKSMWSLLPGRRVSDAATVEGGRSTVMLVDEERRRLSGERSPLSEGGAALAPDEDEADSASSEEEEEEAYQGAPTTLLAELQLRKQQQKMRTRPVHKAFPNGMHSTLLELDAVAQIEAKQRRGKKVNLAWEDPDMNPDAQEEDDEDVPLGMLVAKKQAGNGDISAVAAELNRPLGLMERREMEENEPLSRRRDRLQGKEVPVSMYLNPAVAGGPTRQSVLNLAPSMSALNLNQRGLPSPRLVEPDDDDVEGETLGERMRRLRAKDEAENPLPRTRPVSMTFSAELLSQFGGDDDDAKSKAEIKGKAKVITAPPEEEETLGQRRRRLQAEREAREREMAAGGGAAVNVGALNALNGNGPEGRLTRRLSLADVLSANPLDSARGAMDPREQERLRREEEAARAQKLKDEQMRLYRSQMPSTLRDPTSGMNKAGGYLGGRFNDGNAGGGGVGLGLGLRSSASMGTLNGQMRGASQSYYSQAQGQQPQQYAYGGVPQQQYPQQQHQQPTMNMGMGGYTHPYGTMTMTGAYGNGYAGGMPMPMQMPMQMGGMGMGMQHTQGQLDMVERWRQSIMP